jgi:hypothetical protein
LAKLLENTPRDVGPGSYFNKKETTINSLTNSTKVSTQIQFGSTEARFKGNNTLNPGPGTYSD